MSNVPDVWDLRYIKGDAWICLSRYRVWKFRIEFVDKWWLGLYLSSYTLKQRMINPCVYNKLGCRYIALMVKILVQNGGRLDMSVEIPRLET
mgnify:CR=1 FL=1